MPKSYFPSPLQKQRMFMILLTPAYGLFHLLENSTPALLGWRM